MVQPADTRLVTEAALKERLDPDRLTFGDLFKPRLTTKYPTAKAAVTSAPWVSNYDGVGPYFANAGILPFVKLNGLPIVMAYGVTVDPSGQGAQKVMDVETIFTGKECTFMQYWLNGADPLSIRVFINDEEIEVGALNFGADVSQTWINLVFAVYGTYRIRILGNYWLAAIACDKNSMFQKPAPRKALGIISDSYFESIFNSAVTDSSAAIMATLTGWDVWNGAQGGTGFINPGAGAGFSKYGSVDRLAAIEDMEIDALLVNGSINDQAWAVADVKAAMIQFYADVAEIKPDLPIVQVGIEPVFYGSGPPTLATLVTAQKQAVAVSPNVVGYIDPYTLPWLNGSGDEIVPADDGVQDYLIGADGVHPSVRGHWHYSTLIADHMKPLKASI